MVELKRSDMRIFDDAFTMHSGYVLDFSDRTFADFFEDEFGIEIYQENYRINGSSKAKHLRAFIAVEDAYTVSRVARKLWEHRQTLPQFQETTPENEAVKRNFFALLERIEGGGAVPRMDAIDKFKRDETLEELVAAIDRDISANKPAAALDRLHTYCMKKFAHLLDERGVAFEKTTRCTAGSANISGRSRASASCVKSPAASPKAASVSSRLSTMCATMNCSRTITTL